MTSCRKIMTSLSFFGFFANLEQSGGRIPDTESARVMFSVIGTFSLTETENRTKTSLTQLSRYCFEWRYFFGQKTLIFCKKMVTLAKLRGPRPWKVYFLKLHMDVYLRVKFEVSNIIVTGFRHWGGGGEGNLILPPPYLKTNL